MGIVGVTNGPAAEQPLSGEQQQRQSQDPLTLHLQLAIGTTGDIDIHIGLYEPPEWCQSAPRTYSTSEYGSLNMNHLF